MYRVLLVAAMASLSGCMTASAVSAGVVLDPDSGKECQSNCEKLGMTLEAVVVIRNSTGCVCSARPEGERSRATGGVSAVGGGVVAVLQEQAQEQEQQRHRMERLRQSSLPRAGSPR